MGAKITAKFDGGCKICGNEWNKGDDMFYQKDGGVTKKCTDMECFSQQGGSLKKGFTKAFNTDPSHVIITKVPEVKISEDTEIIGGLWKQYFRKAHDLTKEVYPEEDVSSDRFGMIRQTVINQLVAMAGVVVNKRNQD